MPRAHMLSGIVFPSARSLLPTSNTQINLLRRKKMMFSS